jgi:hypothetical protein
MSVPAFPSGQNRQRRSLLVMALLLLVPCITIPYGQYLNQSLPNIRVWGWSNLLWLLPALPLVWWQEAAGLPALADKAIPGRRRWMVPLLLGSLFGILDIMVIKVLLHPQPYTELPPFLQPFPYSLFLYTSGALEIEIWYRLLPITLVMLAARQWAPQKQHGGIFLTIAIIASLREPLEQWPQGTLWFIVYAALSGFAMNLLQALYLRRAGFTASLLIRLGHYLWWHILLGIYVQYVELAF